MIRRSGASGSRRGSAAYEPDDGGFETMRPAGGGEGGDSHRPPQGDDSGFETPVPAVVGGDPSGRSDQVERSSGHRGPGKTDKSRGPSLKARAVGYLSRREHARNELARKLQPYADDPDEISRVLDALESEGWLSTERFAQSLVHRRAARQGTARIIQELRQHGVADEQVAQLRDDLRATEYQRALEVWRKRFTAKPVDRADYARQARFLASRGFAHEAIRRVLGDERDDD